MHSEDNREDRCGNGSADGVNVALLTIYDMCKAVDKGMEINEVHLLRKSGGKSGVWERQ